MEWWMWIVGGLVCLGLEVAHAGGFIFVFFGLSALCTALLQGVGLLPDFWQQSVAMIALSTGGLTLFRRRLMTRSMPPPRPAMDTLVGEIATPTQGIEVGQTGKVELRGTTWSGHNPGPAPLASGQRCTITRVEGLTVWLTPEEFGPGEGEIK